MKIALNIITKTLRKEGFTCNQTDLAEDALKLVTISKYDVITLDTILPDANGL